MAALDPRLDTGLGVRLRSLAENPSRPAEKVATLELSGALSSLCENDGGNEWDVEVGGSAMILDAHFNGMTPLHSEKDCDCHMDVIAISGLNGHAFGSFKKKGGVLHVAL